MFFLCAQEEKEIICDHIALILPYLPSPSGKTLPKECDFPYSHFKNLICRVNFLCVYFILL